MSSEQRKPSPGLRIVILTVGVAILALIAFIAFATTWCWNHRDLAASDAAACELASKEVNDAGADGKRALEVLRSLAGRKSTHIWFLPRDNEEQQSRWAFWNLRWGTRKDVPIDHLAKLTQSQFDLLGGRKNVLANQAVLRGLLDLSEELLNSQDSVLSQAAAEKLTHKTLSTALLASRVNALGKVRGADENSVLAVLRQLVAERSSHIWFDKSEADKLAAWTKRWGRSPAVTIDYVGQLTEDQFLRFAGDGGKTPPNAKVLKELLAFSETLLQHPELHKPARDTLTERRLDGFFLVNDFAGAIALLEKGSLPNRSAAWQKATAAKLRSHKAMEEKNWKEACAQMLVFIDFMLSDEQKDFEDCDPTTSIVYSREWVVAKNYIRCSTFMKDVNDAAKSKEYRDLADKYFKLAVEKAKDDESALKVLGEEIKANGFTFVPPVKEEKKPAVQAKPAEVKPAEAKPAEAKPAETKPEAQKTDAAK